MNRLGTCDLRLTPQLPTAFLDGVYSPDRDGNGQMFRPAPAPAQQEIEAIVGRASKRILRFLRRRGVITLVTAPGDGEVNLHGETIRPQDGQRHTATAVLLVDGGDGRHGARSVAYHALLALGQGHGARPVERAAHQPHVREVGRGVVAGGASRDDG